ncbi:MAG TPA: hypothetical protein VHO50_10795 [Bacteroidales bacterium]|nr:hypothetical protein [Bacteroidales bacterium]
MFRPRSVLFFFLISLNLCTAFAQNVFRDGYIVKANGDHIEGLIQYIQSNKLPVKCVFKSFDIAIPIVYTPDLLKSFAYRNGQRYESIHVNGKNVFYETIISGDLTLFRSASGYHIRKNGFQIVDIASKEIKFEDGNGIKSFGNIDDLISFLSSGTEHLNDSKDSQEQKIITAVQAYNKKSGFDYISYNRTFSQKEVRARVRQTGAGSVNKGVVAGINMYTLRVKSDNFFLPSSEIEAGLTFGFMYEHTLSHVHDRFLFHGEALFLKQTFYSFNEYVESDLRSNNDTYYSFTAVRFPLLIQYSFTGRRPVPFINAGLTVSYLPISDYLHIKESLVDNQNAIYTTNDNLLKVQKIGVSLVLGSGVKLSLPGDMSLHLEARVEAGNGLFIKPDKSQFTQYSIQSGLLATICF